MSDPTRPSLNRERILQAAVELVDQQGLDALTMRRLGTELGVEAMSLYKHVANKDEILDGMLEFVVGEIAIPDNDAPWRESMRQRAISARSVLTRHSWAIGLLEARGARGPTALGYVDAVLGNLRSAGFAIDDAAHAFWLLDSYVYGHVIQETSMAVGNSLEGIESTRPQAPVDAEDHPHLAELQQRARTSEYSFDGEFEFGLEVVLDGLERLTSPERD